MKKKRLSILLIGIVLLTLCSACIPASANGFGIIEVKATLFTFIPIRGAEVTGENVKTHEIYESYYHKNGLYYIAIPYDIPKPIKKTINVKVVTNIFGTQDETVYDLMENDLAHIDFNFGWDFPLLSQIIKLLLS